MKIGDAIKEYFGEIDEAGGEAAVLRRAAEVNACWIEAVRSIFKKKAAADYILAHTNAVYINIF